jgi:AcrR family transcriptional regulator
VTADAGVDAGTPGRTRKGRETDEAFRSAAFRSAARVVFARDGYLNARISDIAAEAGRSVASFYNCYDTKADLLIALAEEFRAEASALAALPYRAGLGGEEALREAVAGFWRTYPELGLRRGGHPDPAGRRRPVTLTRRRRRGTGALRDLLPGQKRGRMPSATSSGLRSISASPWRRSK